MSERQATPVMEAIVLRIKKERNTSNNPKTA
jgi:hypothetical protein